MSDESTLVELLDQRRYVYQNMETGQASSHSLSVRQLCKLLCPPSRDGEESIPQTRLVSAESQVLRIISQSGESQTYSSDGWRIVRMESILRDAVASWWYESNDTASSSSSDESNNRAVKGPISCRALANLYSTATDATVSGATRVYSESTPSWTPISELPDLRAALLALKSAPLQQPQTNAQEEAYDAGLNEPSKESGIDAGYMPSSKEVKDELESFLSSKESEEDNQDRGRNTDPKPSSSAESRKRPDPGPLQQKSKKQKARFSSKKARNWVYVTGLPENTTIQEVQTFFAKAGILDLNPETQEPKIKLYRYKQEDADTNGNITAGQCKGDASVCYARQESVDLAITLFDGAPFRPTVTQSETSYVLSVSRAKFEQQGDSFNKDAHRVSNAKRRVAKLVARQAMDWDDGAINGRLTGGRKGLRIIVLKNVVEPQTNISEEDDNATSEDHQFERNLRLQCEKFGEVEKITLFSQHPEGVVIVKYAQPGPASEAVKGFDGRRRGDLSLGGLADAGNGADQIIRAIFWDGTTDYGHKDEHKEQVDMEKRLDEFGIFLDRQDLPDELKLVTEEQETG